MSVAEWSGSLSGGDPSVERLERVQTHRQCATHNQYSLNECGNLEAQVAGNNGMFPFKRIACVIFVAIFVVAGFGSGTAADEWSGNYRLEGVNPDGSKYVGNVQIDRKDDGYLVEWNIAGHTFTGQGISRKRVLAVGSPEWIVIYEKSNDGNLVGAWIPFGTFTAGSERLSRVLK